MKNQILLMSLLFAGFVACSPKISKNASAFPEGKDENTLSVANFLHGAVSYGLRMDAFPKDLAQHIVTNGNDFFVGKCNICTPTRSAFNQYLQENPGNETSKVPAEIAEGLQSEDGKKRREAFRSLMNRYSTAHYKRLNMSEAGVKRMEDMLAEDRKRGMGLKPTEFGFCPSCDGACGVGE